MNSRLFSILAAAVLFASSVFGASAVNVSGASNIALSGYDPVAFFTQSQPVHGSPSLTAEYEGATYLFSSAEHQKLFKANPAKYAPQCGGFCAYGVAVGALFPVDVSTWSIVDGKLYLNLNPEIAKAFNADLKGNIKKAEQNWPKVARTAK